MTRTSGSVPEGRTSTLPASPRRRLFFDDRRPHRVRVLQLVARAHPDVDQALRQPPHHGGRLLQRGPRLPQRLQQQQRRGEPVAGGPHVPVDDVARLLAAEHVVAAQHLLHDVAVADVRDDDVDALALHGLMEAQVGHHRRDDRVTAQASLRLQVAGDDGDDEVAVHQAAVTIDGEHPVAVAVEGQPEIVVAGRARLPAGRRCGWSRSRR